MKEQKIKWMIKLTLTQKERDDVGKAFKKKGIPVAKWVREQLLGFING